MTKFRVPAVLWSLASASLAMSLIASAADWPAQFAADGSSPDGTVQWVLAGTALSAPAGLLVAMVVVGFLATRDSVLGTVADVLTFVVAAILLVGSLGETFAPNPVTTPRPVLVVSGLVGLCFVALLVWASLNDLRQRRSLSPS